MEPNEEMWCPNFPYPGLERRLYPHENGYSTMEETRCMKCKVVTGFTGYNYRGFSSCGSGGGRCNCKNKRR